ncbi:MULTISPECIES: HNH endonuclease [unclassified Pseudomonas]|uniref:HNH endonuclease n=1 Tax=Pseudomonas sp. 13.2 TaxID=3144665 RepID=A0AAU7BHC4_9PSED|nr:HNH endonuclease [Pseudomonas sp. SWI36]
MRKIPLPVVNDIENLQLLEASKSDNAQAIVAQMPAMRNRFEEYDRGCGNPWVVDIDQQFEGTKAHLQHLYTSPPVALGFIAQLRTSLAGACPVCGGRGIATLDHYLPKSFYAEFSFYSKNLVPACYNCNTKRGNRTKGDLDGERPVHPYFDAFAERRIMLIEISPPWEAPEVNAVPFDVTGAELVTAKWHIENIIVPAGFDGEIRNLWAAIIRKPHVYFNDTTDINAMIRDLQRWQGIEEESDSSMNGWRSCFIHGLTRNQAALRYISESPIVIPPA